VNSRRLLFFPSSLIAVKARALQTHLRFSMNKSVALGAFALLCCAEAARADVTWEHTATVSAGAGIPLVTFNLRNDWSGQNHRSRLSFDATAVTGAFGGTSSQPARGTVDMIERLGDDRLVLALRNPTNTGATQYVDEPYSTLQSRLRINFFEALDPQFAANADPVPSLTDEQRRRLGQELRAYTKPLTDAYSRQYFRALTETRTINGLTCQGYRYTALTLIPKQFASGPQTTFRVASEFWIAKDQPGDDEVSSFTTKANALKSGPQSVSMWLNEAFPILAEAMPEEQQSFIAALVGRKGEPNYGFRGTPAEFSVTLTPPADAGMGVSDIRFHALLTSHSTDPIPASAFASPTTGTRVEIEPFLATVRNGLKQGRQAIQQGLGGMM